MFWGIEIKNAKIIFDDISWLANEIDFKNDIDFIKEDMLQIEFGNNYLLDVGWRPSFSKKGKFYLTIVKNKNWNEIVEEVSTKNAQNLKTSIKELIEKYS